MVHAVFKLNINGGRMFETKRKKQVIIIVENAIARLRERHTGMRVIVTTTLSEGPESWIEAHFRNDTRPGIEHRKVITVKRGKEFVYCRAIELLAAADHTIVFDDNASKLTSFVKFYAKKRGFPIDIYDDNGYQKEVSDDGTT